MKHIKILVTLLMIAFASDAQISIDDSNMVNYGAPQNYDIGGIVFEGADHLDKDILIVISGLKVGDNINIPGQEIVKAMQNLWKQGLFANISVYLDREVNGTAFIRFVVMEKPRIAGFALKGIRKGEADDLREKIHIVRGKVFTESVKADVVTEANDYFLKKGYPNVKVDLSTKPDTTLDNGIFLTITISKGSRMKIDQVLFAGNENVKAGKLHRLMKNTKQNPWYSIFTTSKFRDEDYATDKLKIISHYNTKGFRNAFIAGDSIWHSPNDNLNIKVNIDEGHKFYFRNITWTGNAKYTSEKLAEVLNIKKGDIYNEERLDKRLQSDPNFNVSSLYMDDGYLFFHVTPVEVSASNDSIDLEMRVYEGPQAIINKIIIKGNTKTNENVIRRVLHTYPGSKFSRTDLIRSEQEIARLGFFNQEKIGVNPIPHPENGTVDIEYMVEEKPSDQLEMSAGWGGSGTGVVGSLGVSFNNFSIRNITKPDTWNPLPSGDGQRFSLRMQSNGKYYQSYNTSFTEPWLGGKKPNSFSVSLFKSVLSNAISKDDANYKRLVTNGVSVGFGQQLKWPDDFFSRIFSVDYQNYNLKNWTSSSFIITNGQSNNVSLKMTLSRNSLSDFTFPKYGSSLTFSAQLTPPFSSINKLFGSTTDYATLSTEDKFKWLEYHKYRFNAEWYTNVFGKFVLKTGFKTGFLGFYNKDIGLSPFERFEIGGDGISNYTAYGRDIISLRGYEPLKVTGGAPIFDKFTMELRYPFSTNPSAFVYGLAFLEGGNSWASFKQFNPFQLYRSAGVGLRIFLPMFGILGFDYGIGFDRPDVPSGSKWGQYGKFNIVLGFEPE